MAAMLQRDEWKAFSDFLALGAAGLLVLIGIILAAGSATLIVGGVECLFRRHWLQRRRDGVINRRQPHEVHGVAGG